MFRNDFWLTEVKYFAAPEPLFEPFPEPLFGYLNPTVNKIRLENRIIAYTTSAMGLSTAPWLTSAKYN